MVKSSLALELSLAHFERAVNHALAYSMNWPTFSNQLESTTLKCELNPVQTHIYVKIQQGHILFSLQGTEPVDLTISATPSAILELAQTKRAGHNIHISGNAHLAQTLQQAMSSLNIDWEGLLAEHLGDLAARQVSTFFTKVKDFSSRLLSTTMADTADYLVDEKQVLPAKSEVDQFYKDVTTLRYDTDRLEARLRLLETQ